MKKFFVILILFMFAVCVYADEQYIKKYNSYPQGTFKKSRNGKIIQYDKNRKKIGVYNINSRKYKK